MPIEPPNSAITTSLCSTLAEVGCIAPSGSAVCQIETTTPVNTEPFLLFPIKVPRIRFVLIKNDILSHYENETDPQPIGAIVEAVLPDIAPDE